jgi:hypothetical protein
VSDNTSTTATATPAAGPRLFRGIAHRLVRDSEVHPFEGTCHRSTAQLRAADVPGTPRARRRGRLLDLHTGINWLRTAAYV